MLEGMEADAVIADKAYDSNAIRQTVKAAGMKALQEARTARLIGLAHEADAALG